MPLQTALTLSAFGYPVVPVRDKFPFVENWHTILWTRSLILEAFETGLRTKKGKQVKADGVGLILRDGLIDFDCDGPAAGATFTDLGLPPTVSWKSARGNHYVYKLSSGALDQLRVRGKKKWVLEGDLEVRTGALQSVVPPSGGREWIRSLIEHEPATLEDVGFLSERNPGRDHPQEVGRKGSPDPIADRPGDAFNRDGDWADILQPLGCRRVGTRRTDDGKEVEDWLRPGTTDQKLSMTTGWCESGTGEPRLYVFTTNCPPFKAGESYSKFEAFCLTQHGGDRQAATKDLARQGYVSSVSAADIFDAVPAEPKPAKPILPSADIVFPGIITQIRDWHVKRSQVVDPYMGAVAGLVLTAWIIGQRVRLEDGTRPNISVLVTGDPGSGKSETRDTVASAVIGAGYAGSVARDIVSGPALEESLLVQPNLLFLRDEVQDLFLKSNQNQYTMTLMSRLKEAFSSSKQAFSVRKKASEKTQDLVIHQPNLVPLLLGTPAVMKNIPHSFYEDGFMARMFHFEVDEAAPRNHYIRDLDVPDDLVHLIQNWRNDPQTWKDDDSVDTGPQAKPAIPVPRVVPCTEGAWARLRGITDEWQNRGAGVERQLYRRGQELTCKLALIGAMSESPDREIDESLVERCIAIIDCMVQQKLRGWEDRGYGDGEYQQLVDRAERYIQKKGRVSWFEAMRGLHFPAKKFQEVLIELFSRGLITSDAQLSPDATRVIKVGTFLEVKK